jgi:mono/diheme cytochrome c family protein
MRHHSFLALFLAVLLVPLSAGCSRQSDEPEQPAARAPEPPDVKTDMHDHFTRVQEIEEAVVRGDLEAAREPARWMAEHQEARGLPPSTETQLAAVRTAARQVAEAQDLTGAAKGAATLVASCGDCHKAASVSPELPPPATAFRAAERANHMAQHQRAVDLLYRGLARPSDDAWQEGATALRESPLGAKDMPEVSKEVVSAEAAVHALADRAKRASDRETRVHVYGELIGNCASCHGLHGRVWGPGIGKAE